MSAKDLTIGQRLSGFMEARGWTLGKLASRSGVSKSQLSLLTRDLIEAPRIDTLEKIASAMSLDVSDLTGETEPAPRGATVIEGVVAVPVSTIRVHANGAPSYDETSDTATTLARYVTGRRADRIRAAIVDGSCMQPYANPGDAVVFDTSLLSPGDGQMVVVLTVEGALLVKWYRVDPLGRPYLRANDGTELRPNGARIIGTVIDINRRPMRDPEVSAHGRRPTDIS